jgi:putative (di)nucleoside polyphosphate hydrolase
MSSSSYYRANAGIVVLDVSGKVLAFERADVPGAWQFPQGGIEENETPLAAAYRELEEETGLNRSKVEFIAEYPEWITYEIPQDLRREGMARGQAQRWFIFRFKGEDSDIKLESGTQEFTAFKWMALSDLTRVVPDFRKGVYEKLASFLKDILME